MLTTRMKHSKSSKPQDNTLIEHILGQTQPHVLWSTNAFENHAYLQDFHPSKFLFLSINGKV